MVAGTGRSPLLFCRGIDLEGSYIRLVTDNGPNGPPEADRIYSLCFMIQDTHAFQDFVLTTN